MTGVRVANASHTYGDLHSDVRSLCMNSDLYSSNSSMLRTATALEHEGTFRY